MRPQKIRRVETAPNAYSSEWLDCKIFYVDHKGVNRSQRMQLPLALELYPDKDNKRFPPREATWFTLLSERRNYISGRYVIRFEGQNQGDRLVMEEDGFHTPDPKYKKRGVYLSKRLSYSSVHGNGLRRDKYWRLADLFKDSIDWLLENGYPTLSYLKPEF